MSQALYRKYRSQRFSELVGQDSVTQILRNSIVRGRLGHAYLFCGPRGTGKTSVARIFAKALNCLNVQDGDACGECVVCLGVAQGNAVDVIEIDAASNRGIDDIRELRERVGYAPLELKYKVYIIDEVHMITIQGFNALLKTLEEPPAHVIFCLCTTEAHKLPITILSRCIRFDFRRIPQQKLADHLVWMAGEEGFELHPEAGLRLAELAEGSARDSISLLDQLMVYCEKQITTADMQELFQLGDPQLAPDTVDQLAAGNPQPLLQTWERLAAQGADAGQFLLKVADELKERYLADSNPAWRRALETVWEGVNLLKFESFPSVLTELTLLNAQAAMQQPAPAAQPMAVQSPPPPVARQQPPQREPTGSRQQPPQREPVRPTSPRQAQQPPAQQPVATPAEAPDYGDPGPEPPPDLAEMQQEDFAPAPERKPEPPPVRQTPPPRPAQPAPVANPVNPGQTSQGAGPEWEDFKQALKEIRTTAYAMLGQAVGWVADGVLVIEFPASAKTAFKYSLNNETSKALVRATEEFFGNETGLTLRLFGDPRAVNELKPAARAQPQKLEVLPAEVTSDVVDDFDAGQPVQSGIDPGRLERDAASMSGEIGSGIDEDNGGDKPATRADFDNLFQPIDLDDKE